MGHFNLNDYDTVDSRISQFWADHEHGAIRTHLVFDDGERVVVRAEVFRSIDLLNPCAVGYAEERRGAGNVNKTSHLENCETSAIGRALANLGYATKKRPSREEMQKAERMSAKPEPEPEAYDAAKFLTSLGLTKEDAAHLKTMFGDNRPKVLKAAWVEGVSDRESMMAFADGYHCQEAGA
jgi:hypothetical protein